MGPNGGSVATDSEGKRRVVGEQAEGGTDIHEVGDMPVAVLEMDERDPERRQRRVDGRRGHVLVFRMPGAI